MKNPHENFCSALGLEQQLAASHQMLAHLSVTGIESVKATEIVIEIVSQDGEIDNTLAHVDG